MVLTTGLQAQANSQKVQPPDSSTPRDYTTPVPQSSMYIHDPREVDPEPSIAWEISASSWIPSNLASESVLPNTSKFHGGSVPQLSLNLEDDLTWLGNSPYKLAARVGFSYAGFDRSGDFILNGGDNSVSQTINLYTLRAGFEVSRPTNFLPGHLTPYVGMAYIPTWEQAASSEFNDGFSKFVNAVEFEGGASCGIPPVSRFLHVENFSLELGVVGTQGLGSSLSGVGVFGGTRIKI